MNTKRKTKSTILQILKREKAHECKSKREKKIQLIQPTTNTTLYKIYDLSNPTKIQGRKKKCRL